MIDWLLSNVKYLHRINSMQSLFSVLTMLNRHGFCVVYPFRYWIHCRSGSFHKKSSGKKMSIIRNRKEKTFICTCSWVPTSVNVFGIFIVRILKFIFTVETIDAMLINPLSAVLLLYWFWYSDNEFIEVATFVSTIKITSPILHLF